MPAEARRVGLSWFPAEDPALYASALLHLTPARCEPSVETYTSHRRGVIRLTDAAVPTVALSGFSGRGFKYAPAVGELAAAAVLRGEAPRMFPAV